MRSAVSLVAALIMLIMLIMLGCVYRHSEFKKVTAQLPTIEGWAKKLMKSLREGRVYPGTCDLAHVVCIDSGAWHIKGRSDMDCDVSCQPHTQLRMRMYLVAPLCDV